MRPISTWSTTEKVAEAIRRSKKYLPAHLAEQVNMLLSPENLAILVGTLIVWAGSHFYGVGEIADVILLSIGAFAIGWSVVDVANMLYEFAVSSVNAQSEQDLDRAARAFAGAVVEGGITVIFAVLLRKSAKQLQATRGPSVRDVMRRRNPALENIGPDAQANQRWRKPTTTGDPALPPGQGVTTAFGDMTVSTAGTATEQQLARIHEIVHSFLSPRFILLRNFRAQLKAQSISRSALLTYLEEALAETIAQLRVNGLDGLLTGFKFPIANGYVSVQQLAVEGAAIGTITVGTHRFTVYFIPSGYEPNDGN